MVGLGLPFAFTMFLPSLLHFLYALLSYYRRWLNKVSNLEIHWQFCSHCQEIMQNKLKKLDQMWHIGQNIHMTNSTNHHAISKPKRHTEVKTYYHSTNIESNTQLW